MNTALLIIDVQTGLCQGVEAAFEIEKITSRINSLAHHARIAGTPVVLIQHEEDEGLLKFGDVGWQLAADLKAGPADLRVRKKAPDSFKDTELQSLLQARTIGRVVICGLQTDCCIDATVRRSLQLGYEVELVADSHSTVPSGGMAVPQIIEKYNRALSKQMNGPGAVLRLAEDVVFAEIPPNEALTSP